MIRRGSLVTTSADEVREYDYDLNGRLTLAKNPLSENQFELDALGNVLREIHSYVQYTNTAAVGFGYGVAGGGSGGAGSLGGGSKGVAPAVYHYVNDQIGTPQILMNAEQEVVWEAQAYI
ncbi:RHS domain-containing protein [Taylorella equigenitalis]|uniref:RHS domain-containing protein n=1 Tax=Taylorella equigenitalis TaxID=29575 RepID=UPI0009DA28D1|nr:RHS domain-containing protein [Taylorella equigenitalis]